MIDRTASPGSRVTVFTVCSAFRRRAGLNETGRELLSRKRRVVTLSKRRFPNFGCAVSRPVRLHGESPPIGHTVEAIDRFAYDFPAISPLTFVSFLLSTKGFGSARHRY